MTEKVLIVDDEPETLEVMKVFIQRLGYQPLTAINGIEALDLAHKEHPELIILDVMMPGMDGFEVARNLHRTPDTATIPILMVTARTADEDKERGYDSGADIYLTKPLHRMDFQANIRSLLLQHRARKLLITDSGFVLGVMAAKGGQGVSTVALNLATTYAHKYGVKVIAAELRPGHGTWADELNLGENDGLDQLLKLDLPAINPASVEKQLVHTQSGLRLLLASNASREDYAERSDAHYEAILASLATLGVLVVLDIGPYSSPAAPAALNQCNELILVTEPQPLPVKNTARLLSVLRPAGYGTSKQVTTISLNHTRSDTIMNMSQMEAAIGRPVSIGFPPALELAAQAQRVFTPMAQLQPESLTGQQFTRLAELLNKQIETHK